LVSTCRKDTLKSVEIEKFNCDFIEFFSCKEFRGELVRSPQKLKHNGGRRIDQGWASASTLFLYMNLYSLVKPSVAQVMNRRLI